MGRWTSLLKRRFLLPRFVACGLAAGALHLAGPAHANGRYPQAMQLIQDPLDGNRLWLRATYGLITSVDRGRTWHWICEKAMSGNPNEVFDPMFGIHADGTVVVGQDKGLLRSKDRGCVWAQVIPELEKSFIQDVAVDPSDRRSGLAISSHNPGPTFSIELWETKNNGASYARISTILDNKYARTVDAAPSDPNRVYISVLAYEPIDGTGTAMPMLLRSDDRGKNWTESALPGPSYAEPYIAVVHPTNPDVLYVRTHESTRLSQTTVSIKSRLLYSDDGAATWREILSGDAPMLGFALSPDGSEVLVGFGDEGLPGKALIAPENAFGMWRAMTSSFEFTKISDRKVGCLSWLANDIYVCTPLEETGFDLGILNHTCPATIRPLFSKRRISGPLPCAAGTTTASLCTDSALHVLCDEKLYCSVPGPALDAGAVGCWDGGSYEGGSNDVWVDFDSALGGSGGADASGSSGGARSTADEGDGCSCRHAGHGTTSGAAKLLAAVVAFVWHRRRRGVSLSAPR